jgi:hypothetical protein
MTVACASEVVSGSEDAVGLAKADDATGESHFMPAPEWMGEVGVEFERYTARPCAGAYAYREDDDITYGDWARQRASRRNLCFEAYKRHVTDWNNPDIWRELDARAYFRFEGQETWSWEWVNLVARPGNNAQYAFDLFSTGEEGNIRDPLFLRGASDCPKVPVEPVREEDLDLSPTLDFGEPRWILGQSTLEVYFWVNGKELRPEGDEAFRVRYLGWVGLECFDTGESPDEEDPSGPEA